MTDTAKPTPEEEEDEFEFEYDCEVKILGRTHTCQIGSLHWQIANKIDALEERVRELENALDAANIWLVLPISNHIDHANPDDNDPIYQQVVDTMRAALAKHGEECDEQA